MKRRNVIKGLALLPLAGAVLPKERTATAASMAEKGVMNPLQQESNVFRKIGVEPVINCRGTFTIIGGSIERPAVRIAMEAASHNFIQYDELATGIGNRLAEVTKTEWGMVSAGCAAGLKHVAAACVTGGNPERLIRIPDLTGFEKTEVIIPRYSRNAYDHAIRNIGVKIINVESAEELEQAINPKTAMIYLTAGRGSETGQPLSLEVIAAIAKPKDIPILMDAAAQNLTIPPIHLERGATIVAYSGGKAICGPQCAGLLLGDKSILMSAWQASSPHHGPGRDNKVGREEMMGMLAAVEDWITRDHDEEWKRWLSWLAIISAKVTTIAGIRTVVYEPPGLGNKSPVLNIIWSPETLPVTGAEIAEEVGRNKPRIALGSRNEENGETSIQITTGQMQPGEAEIVADRLYGVLSKQRPPKPTTMQQPDTDLSGRWDVTIQFSSSTSQHTFALEQEGNWIQGTHRGDLHDLSVNGTIEGSQIKLRSSARLVGDNLNFIFHGTSSGGEMSGDVHLGEYLTAEFTAKRNTETPERREILVPNGPPLAT